MREQFDLRRRRNVPVAKKESFTIEAPPELPRTIELPAWKKALPWIGAAALIGIVVMLFVTGVRAMNPMYLVFMGMMAIGMIGTFQNMGGASEMSPPEVNSERTEYLRYLSGKADDIRKAADAQRKSAQWSHPEPAELHAHVGEERMWERGANDPDYLKIRVGLDE